MTAPPQATLPRRTLLRAGTLVLLLGRAHIARGASVLAVRIWPAEDYTRVTIESDGALQAKQFFVTDPPRLAVDIEGIDLLPGLRELVGKLKSDDPNIAGIRAAQNAPNVVRLVIDLKKPIKPQVFNLEPVAAYQHRLVFDLFPEQEVDPLDALIRGGMLDIGAELHEGNYEIVVRARSRLGQLLITDAVVEGVRATVIIDTGAQSSLGNTALREKIRAKRAQEVITTDVNGVDIVGELAFVRSLTIEGLSLTNVPLTFAEQELDWMALHGVNNPVAMEGQEYVWQQLWREFGVKDSELASYFSGPAFTPWQRMGNIENHLGPLPQSWINKKKDLQLQILQRMQALGMKPVLPAFSGYVPKAFKQRFPNAKINRMEPWSGFDRESYWLDPADPLFATVAKRFLELYQATYPVKTAGQYYLADAFNEMLPPLSGDATDAANRDR